MTNVVAPQSRYLSVNGLQLHRLAWGDPGLPALVGAHGFRGTAHFYDNFAQRFAGRYHVLSESQARRVVRTLANGTLAPVSGAGHAPTLDEPEAVMALEQFLGAAW